MRQLAVCFEQTERVIVSLLQIGVAGRTGCGKSTLMMALYRIVEPSGGRIIIDSCDTSQMGLADLRSRLALVPQVCLPPIFDILLTN